MIRGVEQVSYEDKQRVGVVQPGEGSRQTLQHLPVPKEDLQKKRGERLFTCTDSDRTRGGTVLNSERRDLDRCQEEILHS